MRVFLPQNAAENAEMFDISKDWVAPVILRIFYYHGGSQGKWLYIDPIGLSNNMPILWQICHSEKNKYQFLHTIYKETTGLIKKLQKHSDFKFYQGKFLMSFESANSQK